MPKLPSVSQAEFIRVVLADDHRIFLQGLRLLIHSMPRTEVLGESWTGSDVVSLVKATSPDLAILDIELPELNGIEVTRRLRQENCGTRVLILTAHTAPQHVHAALEAGATGYIVKDCVFEELECAIRTAAAGEKYLSPKIAHVVSSSTPDGHAIPGIQSLTPRQLDLLRLISAGRNIKEIASDLQVSVKTAETHRAKLMQRLNIHEVAGLVRFAIRNGLQVP